MVVLRIAIGWHLCYEGLTKIGSQSGEKPFSSEMYLRNSAGPLRGHFRSLVDDFHGLRKLSLENEVVRDDWKATVARTASYYGFSPEQREEADQLLGNLLGSLRDYDNPDTLRQIREYKDQVIAWEEDEHRLLPTSEQVAHGKRQVELLVKQRELSGPIDEWSAELEAGVEQILTPQQAALPAPDDTFSERTELEKVDLITMYGLTLCGAGLILGLFSRLSALGAAGFLALFYFSMPPWPGLPPNPMAEGNYLIVNKNLIELVACLMLACSPSGVWGGLDSLIRGLITRPIFKVGAQEVIDREQAE